MAIKRGINILLVLFVFYCFFFSDCNTVVRQLEWMQAQRNLFFAFAVYMYLVK